MRRDILKEQKAVVTNMGTSLDGLKSEIDGFSLQSQQFGNYHNYFRFNLFFICYLFLFFNFSFCASILVVIIFFLFFVYV